MQVASRGSATPRQANYGWIQSASRRLANRLYVFHHPADGTAHKGSDKEPASFLSVVELSRRAKHLYKRLDASSVQKPRCHPHLANMRARRHKTMFKLSHIRLNLARYGYIGTIMSSPNTHACNRSAFGLHTASGQQTLPRQPASIAGYMYLCRHAAERD